MYAVRVINQVGLEAANYGTVYGACPEAMHDKGVAEDWAKVLNNSGNWPKGNPGYEVVELETDPTPWCSGCGAMKQSNCHCGPIAANE